MTLAAKHADGADARDKAYEAAHFSAGLEVPGALHAAVVRRVVAHTEVLGVDDGGSGESGGVARGGRGAELIR